MEKNLKEKFEELILDKNKNFKGWDFSYLEKSGRVREFPLSWNYYNEIMDYCKQASSLLDMGTGGGEFLSSLSFLPEDTSATEGYKPNIKIAKESLEPLGIKVYPVEDDYNLPVESESFDLIINRQSFYVVAEVNRILKEKGYFITQQVGALNHLELNLLLGAENYEFEAWDLKQASKQLLNGGFKLIKMKEDEVKTRFYDIGAIIYHLKAISWQIPDFSVDKYYEQLYSIHQLIEKQGYIDISCHRFLIIAQKK
jgi:SAM-dependent methyltransferase